MSLLQKSCPSCNSKFSCGNSEGKTDCWCTDYPPLFQPETDTDCLCPACLKESITVKINEYVNSLSKEGALHNIARDLPKSDKLIEGIDYVIEEGLFVFTRWYHLKRGFCCKNVCKNCPY